MCHSTFSQSQRSITSNKWHDERLEKYSTDHQQYFLYRASKVALKSSMTHKHGCVIVKDNVILSTGFNHQYLTKMNNLYSIHAEIEAIKKLKKFNITIKEKVEMYVVRIGTENFNHCLKYSKPCENCIKCIENLNIKRIYYSTNSILDYSKLNKQLQLRKRKQKIK